MPRERTVAELLEIRLDRAYQKYRWQFQTARRACELGKKLFYPISKCVPESVIGPQLVEWYEEGKLDKIQSWMDSL
jgi:hypothetical protein